MCSDTLSYQLSRNIFLTTNIRIQDLSFKSHALLSFHPHLKMQKILYIFSPFISLEYFDMYVKEENILSFLFLEYKFSCNRSKVSKSIEFFSLPWFKILSEPR